MKLQLAELNFNSVQRSEYSQRPCLIEVDISRESIDQWKTGCAFVEASKAVYMAFPVQSLNWNCYDLAFGDEPDLVLNVNPVGFSDGERTEYVNRNARFNVQREVVKVFGDGAVRFSAFFADTERRTFEYSNSEFWVDLGTIESLELALDEFESKNDNTPGF